MAEPQSLPPNEMPPHRKQAGANDNVAAQDDTDIDGVSGTVRRLLWSLVLLLAILGIALVLMPSSQAKPDRPNEPDTNFTHRLQQTYPKFIAVSTDNDNLGLYRCNVCHDNAGTGEPINPLLPTNNEFGVDVRSHYNTAIATFADPLPVTVRNAALATALATIAPQDNSSTEDSDDDGFTNFEEIVAGTFPGCGKTPIPTAQTHCTNKESENVPTSPKLMVTVPEHDDPVQVGDEIPLIFTITNQGPVPVHNGTLSGPAELTCLQSERSKLQDLFYFPTGRADENKTSIACTLKVSKRMIKEDLKVTVKAATRKGIEAEDSLNEALDIQVADISATVKPSQEIVGSDGEVTLAIGAKNTGEVELTAVTATVSRNGDPITACDITYDQPLRPQGEEQLLGTCLVNKIVEAANLVVEVSGQYIADDSPKRVSAKTPPLEIAVEGIEVRLDKAVDRIVHGEELAYTTVIINTSSARDKEKATLRNIQIDPVCGNASVADLPPGATIELPCVVQALRGEDGSFTQSVSARADVGGNLVDDDDAFTIPIDTRQYTMTVEIITETDHALVGQEIRFGFDIQNDSNVSLSGIELQVPKAPHCNQQVITLEPRTEASYDCRIVIAQHFIERINNEPVYSLVAMSKGIDTFDQTIIDAMHTMELSSSRRVLLPITQNPLPATDVDLVVESITVDRRGVTVVIRNVGDATLEGVGYWVDLYFNPNQAPTAVNQVARDWDEAGIVWGIPASASRLEAGQRLQLRVADPFYVDELSWVPRELNVGDRIYVQVDSANQDTTYGAVLERHERLGDSYNNIGVVTLTQSFNTDRWPEVEAAQHAGQSQVDQKLEVRRLQLQTPREGEE